MYTCYTGLIVGRCVDLQHNKPQQYQPKRGDLKTNTIGTDIVALLSSGITAEYKKLINDIGLEVGFMFEKF